MPRKRKQGSGLAYRRPKKALVLEEQLPSLPAEEVLLPVEDVAANEECLPNADFEIDDDNTCTILRATSDQCATLNTQASRLAIAYYYIQVLDEPPPEEKKQKTERSIIYQAA